MRLLFQLLYFGRYFCKFSYPVFVKREVVLPLAARVIGCETPVAFFSYAPLLACVGGISEKSTSCLLAALPAGAIITSPRCRNCCWRRQQQKQGQLPFLETGHSWPLYHQRRVFATIVNSETDGVKPMTSNNSKKCEEQKLGKERPRLICMARWSKTRVGAVSVVSSDSGGVQMCSSVADILDASGGGCVSFRKECSRSSAKTDMCHRAQHKKKKDGTEKEHEELVDCEVCQEEDVAVSKRNKFFAEDNCMEMSTSTPAVEFPCALTVAPKSYDNSDEGLVYNIFTHRVVKCFAASVRALAVLGIAFKRDTQQLDVVDPTALLELRNKLVNKHVSWPNSWRSALFRQVLHILLTKPEQELVEEVRRLVCMHYDRVKIRRGVGVVTNDNGATPGSETSDNEATVSQTMSLQERLFTYHDLNEEQQRVADFVLEGHNTYIGGGAGTGKSLLLRVIKQKLASEGLSVAMTATTGIAAARIGGVTLHHCFGLNVYGECTRRAELQSFDVIIVDEVSMLSKELFESLEYQLRRANGVDLPFGGVQLILSGDFLQLGAIAATSLVHSAVFRRYFAMLKLQQVVRQMGNPLFLAQLQELRRGVVPSNLQDTILFLSPSESAKKMKEVDGAVKLLPTNQQVDAVNQVELEKLPGELITFPAQLRSPTLVGRWTATYILAVSHNYTSSVDTKKLVTALEQYVLEFVKKMPHASAIALPLFGQRHVVFYRLFVDAFVLRVRIPQEMNEEDEREFASYLRNLEVWLPAEGFGVCLKEIVESPNGLHTDVDEYTLTQYAKNSPMMTPLGLKKGAKVMLRTNLSSSLVNGSLGVVVGFKELRKEQLPRYFMNPARVEAVESYTEYLQYEHGFPVPLAPEVDFGGGRIVVVPPITFCVGGLSNTNHYHMGIVALPLSLAYAFTVHKVQGLTLLGRVHLELSRMWPCEHLLYVAMSRVRNPEQLTVSHFHSDLVRCATECLLFDESLPSVQNVRVLPHFFQATWRRHPGRRKAVLRQKKLSQAQKHGIVGKQKSTLPKQNRQCQRVL